MKFTHIMSLLPPPMANEIRRLVRSRAEGEGGVSEIRLRRDGLCSLRLGQESLRLFSGINRAECDELVKKICDGALYAHRDSIASGFVSLPGGVRVGLCGRASYDGGSLVGISDMRSLVFRIPTGKCSFSEELYEIFSSGVGSGMLIYSPPGVGKTTALRSLARSLGAHGLRVVAVDERCEFSEEDYADCEVDILRGYRRREGIEIATRTLSPDLIMIDELSGDEAAELCQVMRCGIPIVATVHASSKEEILQKPSLSPLLSCGAFDVLVGISLEKGQYILRTDRL